MKRLLAIILFALVTIGIGFALYWFFFRAAAPGVVTNVNGGLVNGPGGGLTPAVNGGPSVNGAGGGGGLNVPTVNAPAGGAQIPTVSPVASGGITQTVPIGAGSTLGASVTTGGQVQYYDRNSGKFYRIGTDGTVSLLSNQKFFNVSAATFDPSGNKAVLEYPDGSNITYDFATGTQHTLPPHWEDFGWTANGGQVVAKSIGLDDNNRFLVMSGADGTGAHAVQELGANADKVTVAVSPTGQVIATAATGNK
ncbi:MAG: hypothetical protein RLZZ324_785, partial [Candidatus Parcubacteria bacterium]